MPTKFDLICNTTSSSNLSAKLMRIKLQTTKLISYKNKQKIK